MHIKKVYQKEISMKKLLSILAFLYLIAFSNASFANDNPLLSADFLKKATPETVQQMIDKGYNVNDRTEGGFTPIMFASALNTNPEIIRYIDAVRSRAGIPGYQELKETGKKDIIGDKELQARAIRQERQVELYLEGQRYFDIRRWMICGPGEEADQTEYWGMNVWGSKDVAPGDPNSFFTRTLVRKHNWKRAMYLYPIPYREVEISSGLVVQNPLW